MPGWGAGLGGWGGGGPEFAELSWLVDVQGGEDAGLGVGGGGAPFHGVGRSGEGAEVDLVEVVAHVPPRVPGAGFGDTDQQEGEPAQHDVSADAGLEAVVDGSQFEGGLHVAPAPFDLEELLVAERDVFDRQGRICGAQQELAVETFLGSDRGTVHSQQSGRGGAQEPAQPGGQPAGELGPFGGGELVGAVDGISELSETWVTPGMRPTRSRASL